LKILFRISVFYLLFIIVVEKIDLLKNYAIINLIRKLLIKACNALYILKLSFFPKKCLVIYDLNMNY